MNLVKEVLPYTTDEEIFADEAIKLMSVHGEMALAFVQPYITLIHRHTDNVRHEIREAMVMIAFHPDDLDPAFGIGELADIGEEFPMLAGQATEVEIGKNIAEQDEAAKAMRLQNVQGILGAAKLRPQVDIGHNQRVACVAHAS